MQNFVSSVTCEISGTDGTNIQTLDISFGFKPYTTGNFKPFIQLVESDIVGWIQTRLGADGVSYFQNLLDLQLSNLNSSLQTVKQSLPWV